MNAADRARALAVNFEAKKDSLAQRQSGEWKLSFTVQAGDVPTELLTAPMGTRYMVALVEIGDDEQPAERPVKKPKDNPHKLSQQAAMICNDVSFHVFLKEKFLTKWDASSFVQASMDENEIAAHVVRSLCGIASRSNLDTDKNAADLWRDLKAEYEAWLRM
jgi:hypothetical protein